MVEGAHNSYSAPIPHFYENRDRIIIVNDAPAMHEFYISNSAALPNFMRRHLHSSLLIPHS